MDDAPQASAAIRPDWNWRHLTALLIGNVMLALGPWSVRLADSGPVAAAFWRLALALPFLALLARVDRQKLSGFAPGVLLAVAGAGIFFALDLAAWHIGIGATRLANATLFGNSGSLILMAWGLIAVRRLPYRGEALAFVAAMAGAVILMGRSIEIDAATGNIAVIQGAAQEGQGAARDAAVVAADRIEAMRRGGGP